MAGVAGARLLVVDDEDDTRRLLEIALSQYDYEIFGARNFDEAVGALRAFDPHLSILDVDLGAGRNGFDVAKVIRNQSDQPIIFLTAAASMEYRLAGFETGADDYLCKPFELAELLARVRALLRRSKRPTEQVWSVGQLTIDEAGQRALLNGTPIDLTRIEFGLLLALARQSGKVASKSELLGAVWGFEGYDPNLVEVHISSLRRKLGPTSSRIVETVRGAGYVIRP